MTARIAEASPRFLARIAGVFFLLTIQSGIFAQASSVKDLLTSTTPRLRRQTY
jgi:hypothetical protein